MGRNRLDLRPLAAAGLLLACVAAAVPAQVPEDPFIPVDAEVLARDKAGVWTLNFAYLPPRVEQVDTPTGKKTVLYMVYKVWNASDTPVTFVPEFELVTRDGELRSFLDQPAPTIFDRLRKIEDKSITAQNPKGELNIQSSVAIMANKIPVTKAESVPRAVYGIAVWPDFLEKAPTTNNFSVFVGGLSNGLALSESDGGGETVTRKTLQLDFFRPTDTARPGAADIRPNDNSGLGAEKWIYRAAPVRKPADKAAPSDEKKNGK